MNFTEHVEESCGHLRRREAIAFVVLCLHARPIWRTLGWTHQGQEKDLQDCHDDRGALKMPTQFDQLYMVVHMTLETC